ncbi:MAG: hypothetical protein KC657_32005 [Myxococcales bacterium]|nr:hypothetical protein [Myxococcales bacterium]
MRVRFDPVCPACHCRELVRSRRRALELLISRLGLYPFRCPDCNTRSLHFSPRADRWARH